MFQGYLGTELKNVHAHNLGVGQISHRVKTVYFTGLLALTRNKFQYNQNLQVVVKLLEMKAMYRSFELGVFYDPGLDMGFVQAKAPCMHARLEAFVSSRD